LPHLTAGVSGRSMPTPFASPPFRGLSSPAVNVAWALTNLALSYVLLMRVASVDLQRWPDVGAVFLGFGAMALQCARAFGRLRTRGTDRAA
jgi:hypothetical protein